MAYEMDIEKWHGGVLIKYRDVLKALKFFSTHDETGKEVDDTEGDICKMEAIRRAVAYAVKDVKLSKKEEDACVAFSMSQLKARMERRKEKKVLSSGGTVPSVKKGKQGK